MSTNQKQQQKPSLSLPIDQNSLAWKIFNAFVSDGQIKVTESELLSYAMNDLKLSEYGYDKLYLPPGLTVHLPVILVAYMNMWSGWHFKGEFLAGKFQKEHYFQRFHKFMAHKMNGLIRGQFVSAMSTLRANNAEESTSAVAKKEPAFSPYAIAINCPAHMLNTIAFANVGDDVIMKQHLGAKWLDLTPVQLVNWPHIEVTFRSEDLYFIRRQATEFVRYLNFLPHETNEKHAELVIEHAESYVRPECYSYEFLEKYIKVYLDALKSVRKVPSTKLHEIQTVLIQFLEDVRYIDVNKSMATNTVVLFRLSPVPFIRNKKLVKNSDKERDEARVGYCELISPKIQLCLFYFKAKQKESPVLSFEFTDKIKNSDEDIQLLPHIKYRCTFCKVEHSGPDSRDLILQHMKAQHKMEQHVRCTMCKKQFDVLSLATCRWRHKCVSAST